jgi:mycothiol synthase
VPSLPAGFIGRPLQAGDVAAVADLLTAAEPLDDTGEHSDTDDLTEWWTFGRLAHDRDGLVVLDAAGDLVAYAAVLAPPTSRDAFRIYLDGRVHARTRGAGIGRALLDWEVARGRQLHAERHPEARAKLTVAVPAAMSALESLVRRAGFTAERWYRQMQRPLTELPDAPAAAGVDLVPFDWDRDNEVRRAHNAAFVEHHGSSEHDLESWRAMFTGERSFRPDLSVLAVEDGAVVGYALVYVYAADTRVRGHREAYLGQIGVLHAGRGRGVGTALIVAALGKAAAADCATAGLDVDSDNVTGALRLYDRLGFVTTRTRVSWALSVPPVRALSQTAAQAEWGYP